MKATLVIKFLLPRGAMHKWLIRTCRNLCKSMNDFCETKKAFIDAWSSLVAAHNCRKKTLRSITWTRILFLVIPALREHSAQAPAGIQETTNFNFRKRRL